MLLFIDCKSTQTESTVSEKESLNNETLVLYCNKAEEVYFLENEKEIKQVLRLLPRIPNIFYDIKFVLEWGIFGPYPDYSLMVKKNGKVLKEFCIDIDNRVWITNKSFLTTWVFPRKNIEKIIAKMHKGIKHTETIEGALEQRKFIEELRADENVLYIDKQTEGNYDRWSGSFYFYVPGSKDEIINSREFSREVLDNLHEHYGDTKNTFSKSIHHYTDPKLTRYIEETQEFEFEMRWTKEMYDKVDIYRKSEFSSESPALHDTIEYFTKD